MKLIAALFALVLLTSVIGCHASGEVDSTRRRRRAREVTFARFQQRMKGLASFILFHFIAGFDPVRYNPAVCPIGRWKICPPLHPSNPQRARWRIIFLIVFMDLLGFGIIIPLLAVLRAGYRKPTR